MNCSWKYVFIRRLERGHHLSYLYNISLKVLQCRVGEGQYEEDVVVTMFAERQNVVLHGQHGDDGSLPGRGQRGDPEPGATGDLHSLDDAFNLQSYVKETFIKASYSLPLSLS